MKYIISLIFVLQGLFLFAQNDKTHRESFILNLAYDSLSHYEQEVEASAYFVKDQLLQIYATEKIFIEVEFSKGEIRSMKTVKENVYPDKTIEIEFKQEVENESNHFMTLKTKNPFTGELRFDVYIYPVGGKNWEKTSMVPIQPKSMSYEIWYNAISTIAIENWQLKLVDLKEESFKRKNIASEEKKDSTINWLKRNKITLNTLPNAFPKEINYTCDSILFLKEHKNDTTIIWAHGVQAPLDTNEVVEFIKKPSYGKTSYLREVYRTGKVNSVQLMPYTFYIKKDSLFELENFYNISKDSMRNLYDIMFSNFEDKEKVDSISNIIEANTYQEFKLIYHPKIFKNNLFVGNKKKDKISIKTVWQCKGKRYFEIEILDGYSDNGRKETYIFDENYKWLKYDGCNKEGIECLRDENIIKYDH